MTPACTVIVRSMVLISSILFSRSSEITTSSGEVSALPTRPVQTAVRDDALSVRVTQRERFADARRIARPYQRFRLNAFAAPDARRAVVHVGAGQHRVVA